MTWRPDDFNDARDHFLEAMVAEMNMPLFKLIEEYQNNPEFKERVDTAALMMSGGATLH